MQAAVRKLGNSAGVIIPKSFPRLRLTVGDTVDMRLEGGRRTLVPFRKPSVPDGPRHHRPSPFRAMTR